MINEESEKYREIARRARETGDYATAESNYTALLQCEPDNWEAYFYSVYFRASQCKIGEIKSAANLVTSAIPTAVRMLKNSSAADFSMVENINYQGMAMSVLDLHRALVSSTWSHYNKFKEVNGTDKELEERCCAAYSMLFVLAGTLWEEFGDKSISLKLYNQCLDEKSYISKDNIIVKIKEIDPAYGSEVQRGEISAGEKSSTIISCVMAALLALFGLCVPVLGLFGIEARAAFAIGLFIRLFLGIIVTYISLSLGCDNIDILRWKREEGLLRKQPKWSVVIDRFAPVMIIAISIIPHLSHLFDDQWQVCVHMICTVIICVVLAFEKYGLSIAVYCVSMIVLSWPIESFRRARFLWDLYWWDSVKLYVGSSYIAIIYALFRLKLLPSKYRTAS